MITKDSKNILITDDSRFSGIKLSDILLEAGHKVRLAKNGGEVIEEIKADGDGIDLLILDMQMPEFDGFEVLNWIKDSPHKRDLLILGMTGTDEAGAFVERLKKLGADGVISKGQSPEQVIFNINKLLFSGKFSRRSNKVRVYVRIPVDLSLERATCTGYILNISEGGAYIHTDAVIQQGDELRLIFSLPRTERVLAVTGRVKWSSGKMADMSMFYGYGLEYSHISEEDRKELVDFIAYEKNRLDAITT